MQITRYFTTAGASPFAGIAFKTVDIEICHTDPAQRLCVPGFEVPEQWSYAACDYLARHFLRKTGVPVKTRPHPAEAEKESVPAWLWPSVANEEALNYLPESERYGSEISARQVFHRLAGAWTYWGWRCDYFDTEEDARAFYDECCYLMARQMIAPAAPQWLNTGLHWAYGIDGPAQGHYHIEPSTGRICKSESAYERPQHHHCFIQSVRDDLVNDGGIMDLWEREARLFKYGSGAGCNMSGIRGEHEVLSGGALSGGLMKFLAIGDKAAGAIKPGGIAGTLEKLVIVDIDHPDIENFVRWKTQEEHKAAALVTGSRQMRKYLSAVMQAAAVVRTDDGTASQRQLRQAIAGARRALIPESYVTRVLDYVRQGFTEITLPVFEADGQSEIYLTIGAHQAHMAVRVPDLFLKAVETDADWSLVARNKLEPVAQLPAIELLEQLAQAAWATGDPAVQFSDTINSWHGCKAAGQIQASGPRGEFLFLNDTACDIATLNVAAFVDGEGEFTTAAFEHVVRLMVVMLDIAITMAQYPSREIARNTYRFRPIGLSYCNLSSLLMQMGYAYDSDEGRATAAAVTALMTGAGYAASAELARELGAFEAFSENRDGMMHLLWRHHEAAFGRTQYLGSLHVMPQALDHASLADAGLSDAVQRVWDMAMIRGDEYGYSNAQISLIAASAQLVPLMDVQAESVAPLQSLVCLVPHPEGGVQRQVLPGVIGGLRRLGYHDGQIADIARHLSGSASLMLSPAIDHASLREKGFSEEQLVRIEDALNRAPTIRYAFDPFILGEAFCRDTLGLNDAQLHDAGFDLLSHLGYSIEEINTANRYACGAHTIDQAPHISDEDQAVFAVLNWVSQSHQTITVSAQLRLMAAIQPFVSGGIAHIVQVRREEPVQQCRDWLLYAWRLGLKSLSLWREGAGLYDQPARSDEKENEELLSENISGIIEEKWKQPWIVRHPSVSVAAVHRMPESAIERQTRRAPLPTRRAGYTQKAAVGGQTVYLRTGEYPDGRLGEIFIDMPKQNATMRSMVNHFAIAVSIALQHGVPLSSFVDAFRMSQFDPAGHVEGSDNIETATSILDYIFRELSLHYGEAQNERSAEDVINSVMQNATIRDILMLNE